MIYEIMSIAMAIGLFTLLFSVLIARCDNGVPIVDKKVTPRFPKEEIVGKLIWFIVPNGQIVSGTVVKEEDTTLYTENGHKVHTLDYFDSFHDALDYKQLAIHDDWSNPL